MNKYIVQDWKHPPFFEPSLINLALLFYNEVVRTMPTIQFTFNKSLSEYCFGFWVDGVFIVRGRDKDKEYIWDRFKEELEQLEEEE